MYDTNIVCRLISNEEFKYVENSIKLNMQTIITPFSVYLVDILTLSYSMLRTGYL